ncbi:MAG: hypothetical protein GF320_09285 [Armatimonadia bacterium]|nr:hypothetical protein [Armatimonadia bacterium]
MGTSKSNRIRNAGAWLLAVLALICLVAAVGCGGGSPGSPESEAPGTDGDNGGDNGTGDDGGDDGTGGDGPPPSPIGDITASQSTVGHAETVELTVSRSGSAEAPVEFFWSASVGSISGIGDTVDWTSPSSNGEATISVFASDASGATGTASTTITVDAGDLGVVITEAGG